MRTRPRRRATLSALAVVIAISAVPAFGDELLVTDGADDPKKPVAGSLREVLSRALPGDTIRFRARRVEINGDLEIPVGLDGLTVRGPATIAPRFEGWTLSVGADDVVIERLTFKRVAVRVGDSADRLRFVRNRVHEPAQLNIVGARDTVIGAPGEGNLFAKRGKYLASSAGIELAGDTRTIIESNRTRGPIDLVGGTDSQSLVIRGNRVHGAGIRARGLDIRATDNRVSSTYPSVALAITGVHSDGRLGAAMVTGNRLRLRLPIRPSGKKKTNSAGGVSGSDVTVTDNRIICSAPGLTRPGGFRVTIGDANAPTGASGIVRANVIRGAAEALTIETNHAADVLSVENNEITNSFRWALRAASLTGRVEITGNRMKRVSHSYIGVELSTGWGQILSSGNVISGGTGFGVALNAGQGGAVEMRADRVQGMARAGVVIGESIGELLIDDCEIVGNLGAGVRIEPDGFALIDVAGIRRNRDERVLVLPSGDWEPIP